MSEFLEGLESSGWLKHIKAVMDAGIFIAKVSVLTASPLHVILVCVCFLSVHTMALIHEPYVRQKTVRTSISTLGSAFIYLDQPLRSHGRSDIVYPR